MYIPDLAKYLPEWGEGEKEMNLIAVGWLDIDFPYPKGEISIDAQDKLEQFCSNAMIRNFGVEFCSLCSKDEFVTVPLKFGKIIQLFGTYEIRIPSSDGKKVYAAPDFILHHVITHNYKPPQEFLDSLLIAPLPGTPEFEKFAEPWSQYR